ncbi:hypothetical protein IKS57_01070 [bacterium]|nr:hypothetical protein [bacterium]
MDAGTVCIAFDVIIIAINPGMLALAVTIVTTVPLNEILLKIPRIKIGNMNVKTGSVLEFQ